METIRMNKTNKLTQAWTNIKLSIFNSGHQPEIAEIKVKNSRMKLAKLMKGIEEWEGHLISFDKEISELKSRREHFQHALDRDAHRLDEVFEEVYGESMAKRYASDIKDNLKKSVKKDLERESEKLAEEAVSSYKKITTKKNPVGRPKKNKEEV